MKSFVTGGHGFLGTRLVKRLISQGHEVIAPTSKECDLRVAGALDPWKKEAFDQIYHLAAWTQAGDFCLHHPGEQWVINQKINTHVLHFWLETQPQAKLIAMGTSCSYDPTLPHTEDNYLTGKPIHSLFTYAMTKRMLLTGMMALAQQYDLKYLYAIPSTLYGPDYHTDGRQMHFIFDLMRKILRGKERGDPVQLWGDGYQRREIIHVDEFLDHLFALNATHDNLVVNIGAGREHTIREFALKIAESVGYDANRIDYDTTRYVGARSKVLNIDRLKQLLPHRSCIPLDEGIASTLHWMTGCKAML